MQTDSLICFKSVLGNCDKTGMELKSKLDIKGGGHFDTFTGPMLFSGYRPHLLIYFDVMLYGSLC